MRTYKDRRDESYEADIRLAYRAALRAGNRPDWTGKDPLALDMTAFFPVPASWSMKKKEKALAGAIRPTVKPDGDNVLKQIDALNGVAFEDDSQIVEMRVRKLYGAVPCLAVVLTKAAPGEGGTANATSQG